MGLASEVKAVFLGTRPLNLWSLMLIQAVNIRIELNYSTFFSGGHRIGYERDNSEMVGGVRKLEIFFNKNY